MKTLIHVPALATLLLLTFTTSIARATSYEKILDCNAGELVVDVDRHDPSRLQLVVRGALPRDVLLHAAPPDEIARLKLRFAEGGNALVIPNLVGIRRTGGFVHVHEGAGFYPAAQVSVVRTIDDVDVVRDVDTDAVGNAGTRGAIDLDFFAVNPVSGATGLGGFAPIRNPREVILTISGRGFFNRYIFVNCGR